MKTSTQFDVLLPWRGIAWTGLTALLLLCAAVGACAQEEESQQQTPDAAEGIPQPEAAAPQPAAAPAPSADTKRLTVRGMVRSLSSGQGVARALVRIEGDATTGALTDGDGRFEIPGVPAGPQIFTVLKPGFLDLPFGGANASGQEGSASHNVQVAAGMPELVFSLAPTAALHGSVRGDDGEPLAGIRVTLVQRIVQAGRTVWRVHGSSVKTHADGSFRFGSLTAGDYSLFTDPQLEKERVDEADANSSGQKPTAQMGYPAIYAPGTRTPDGTTHITLAAGEDQETTLVVPRELFQPVEVAVLSGNAADSFAANVLDPERHPLPYFAKYSPQTHTVQTLLPDGSYILLIYSKQTNESKQNKGRGGVALGEVEVRVAAKPPAVLTLKPLPQQMPPVEVGLQHGATLPLGGVGGNLLMLASPATGWIDDEQMNAFAQGNYSGPLATSDTPPGLYWMHTSIGARGVCESSLTAGGVSMASEPLHVQPGSSTPTLNLTLRDDCARLTLQLPGLPATTQGGEEPWYTAYIVPDFAFSADLLPVTLRPSNDGAATLDRLTPGSYRVYVFPGPYPLEYHNPDALAALSVKPQFITLGPGEEQQLVVEVPEP
ncbi:carboxypeptidase-like regulatory domain-containing protein [Telmatobacter bradus]|uniref:carboxypeptidase-like regulatory domain-containing protein n=1 Tax=Telmatobacter bradus TaxID=474953 RepID=UPI003B434B63